MQIICKIAGYFGFAILSSFCVKKEARLQSTGPESKAFLDIYEEPTPLPLDTLIEKLRGHLRAKMPKPKGGLAFVSDIQYVACGETLAISGANLCIFSSPNSMNFALNRASQWVEAKEMVGHRELFVLNSRQNVQGHNLSSHDLKDFAKAYAQVKASFDQEVPPLAQPQSFDDLGNGLGIERDFWAKYVQKKLESTPQLYLLAASIGNSEAINHEILHALYHSSPKMQELVKDFWIQELSLDERKTIISDLASGGSYDVWSDDPQAPSFLLLNEFQAYVLMARPEGEPDKFDSMSKLYKTRLQKKLQDSGIQLP